MRVKLISILIIAVATTNLFAFDFYGAPTADLKKDQVSVGISFSSSDADIKLDDNFSDFLESKFVVKDLQQEKLYLDFGLAGNDDFELIFRIGTSKAKPGGSSNSSTIAGYINESEDSFAFGGGVKFTLYRSEYMDWGFSAMLSHARYSFERIDNFSITDVNFTSMEASSSIIEAVISTGPVIKFDEHIKIYGGPFFHIISGDLEAKGTVEYPSSVYSSEKQKVDFRQDNIIGAQAGIQYAINDNASLNLELQATSSASGLAGSFIFRF